MVPSRRLLYCVLGCALAGILVYFYPSFRESWLAGAVALCIFAFVDASLVRQSPSLTVERQLQGVWPVGHWQNVSLKIHNTSLAVLRVNVFDDYPTNWTLEGLPHQSTIAAGGFIQITYRALPNLRGDAEFGLPHIRVDSQFGFWQKTHRIGTCNTVKVFPDFSKLLGHTLAATDRRSATAGVIRKRRRGEGTDFRQLREYREGDSQRSIDWKATARHQKPITREFQEERDQQVVFLLDTGRRMLSKDGDTSHFDHALNAVISLSFIAQKQGDAVGLLAFGGDNRWISPHKGRIGLDRILSGVYDLHASEAAPDYALAANALLTKLRKRAFVVLITNLRDEDDQAMRTACEYISTKHLVMCASLRERSLDTALTAPVERFTDALRYSATLHYLQQRSDAIKRLGIRSTHLIDIAPEQLSMALVNRYLDIKESGQL